MILSGYKFRIDISDVTVYDTLALLEEVGMYNKPR